jgi:hypothetical protein
MTRPLMPKATAVWLLEKTTLTFEQIADFCQMHTLEIQAIADGDVASNIMGLDPISGGQLTADEIKRCEADAEARLQMVEREDVSHLKKKTTRYTSLANRLNRPNAIAWLLEKHPELTDKEISKLIHTTKPAIEAIRNGTYKGMADLEPQNPAALGLCSDAELAHAVALAVKVIKVD